MSDRIQEGLKSQQQFLKDLGFYKHEVDGIWGPESRRAMIGFAYTSSVGCMKGNPLTGRTGAPVGYTYDAATGLFAKEGSQVDKPKESPKEPIEVNPKTAEGSKVEEPATDKPTNPPEEPNTEGDKPKESFIVTGRSGDKVRKNPLRNKLG